MVIEVVDVPGTLSMPNPETNTRLAITEYMLARPCPGGANAAPLFAKAWCDLERLLDLSGHHPAMAENNTQTFNTLAISKNKVYSMWDFIHRTLSLMVLMPDPSLRQPGERRKFVQEIVGRNMFGVVLMKNTTGKLKQMNMAIGNVYATDVEFGPEILGAADELARR